jgi:acetylornithine deacetylase/succinyl-diaminopimelate desuccinylase-like protein
MKTRLIRTLAMIALVASSLNAQAASKKKPPSKPKTAGKAQGTSTDATTIRRKVREYRVATQPAILRELVGLLEIPNLASDTVNIRRNAAFVRAMLARRGVETRLLEGRGPPAVYGELRAPGATRTIVFYAHYDGQPVDPSQWRTAPWSPTMRSGTLESGAPAIPVTQYGDAQGEWRLYARSASDVKFFFEGEEEAGSANLGELLRANADLLKADAWIFCDGPIDQSRRQQVVFGVRGVVGAEITVYGPNHPLHSGHYGNWAPNPAVSLATLVASMRDEEGKILIDGFYDDVRPKTAAEREAILSAPSNDSVLKRDLALGRTESQPSALLEQLMLPALNVRGLQSGKVGSEAANAIPVSATVSIDFRLVPAQTPEHIRVLLENHLQKMGYRVVNDAPTTEELRSHAKVARLDWEGGYPAYRVAIDHPASKAVLRVVSQASESPVMAIPTLGGSLPLYTFAEVVSAPLITLPMVNHDNNQHAANENLRLQNLWDGIEMYAAVIARLGKEWR